MANPYHDETGKFCSRDEMKAAIDKAAKSGNLELYSSLRKDMDEIEKGKLLVDKDTVMNALFVDKKLMTEENPENIRVAYEELVKKKDVTGHGWHADRYAQLFLNPNTPEDIKEKILEKAVTSPDTTLANTLMRDRVLTREQERELLTRQPIDRYLISSSPVLTDKDKLDVALLQNRYDLLVDVIDESKDPNAVYASPGVLQAVDSLLYTYEASNKKLDYRQSGTLNIFLSTAPSSTIRDKAFKLITEKGGEVMKADGITNFMINGFVSNEEKRQFLAASLRQTDYVGDYPSNSALPNNYLSNPSHNRAYVKRFNELVPVVLQGYDKMKEYAQIHVNTLGTVKPFKEYKKDIKKVEQELHALNKTNSLDKKTEAAVKSRVARLKEKRYRLAALMYSTPEGVDNLKKDKLSVNSQTARLARDVDPYVRQQLIKAKILSEFV